VGWLPLRIAVFHMGFMYSGGGERTAICESLLLRRMGHEVACFAPAVRPDACFPDLIGDVNPQGFLPKVKAPLLLRDFLSLALSSFLAPLYARRFADFDVLLCHGQPATWIGYCAARALRKPYICYLHQPARFLYPRAVDLRVGWKTKRDLALLDLLVRAAKPLVRAWDRTSVDSADALLVNSRWTARLVEEIYGRTPGVCPPGVDTRRYKPFSAQDDPGREEGVRGRPYILSTNRHYPQKGLAYLIAMMPRILRERDVDLVLTGDFTRHTGELRRMAGDLKVGDRVVFTGRVSEDRLVRLYQGAEVYAYPSPYEDFGLGPVEAMACGTPAVVWDRAGPAETVVDGVTGFRARPYSLDDFADKVLRLLGDRDLRRRMGEGAADFARRSFPWERHVEVLESALRTLA